MNNLSTVSVEEAVENTIKSDAVVNEMLVKAPSLVHENTTKEPSMDMLLKTYATQNRECWLCDGIAKKISNNITLSDDDSWHFTSCVMSWEHVHRLND